MHLTEEEQRVLSIYATHGYEETAQIIGRSRGYVYSIAKKAKQLKFQGLRDARDTARREALATMLNETSTMGVLDFFERMPDNSIDAVISSPPYNLGFRYGGDPLVDAMRHLYYEGFCAQVMSEVSRTLKPGGTAFIVVGLTKEHYTDYVPMDGTIRVVEREEIYPLDTIFDRLMRQARLTFQNRITLVKSHGLTPKQRLKELTETALVFSKGPQTTFFPNGGRIPHKNPAKRAFKGPHKGQISSNYLGAWPTTFWDCGQVKANHPEFTQHPAQFTELTARRAILIYSQPGALICDPFSGSGTVQVQAKKLGRDFIGADLYYEDVRRKRLASVFPEIVTQLPGVTPEAMAVWQAYAQTREFQGEPISDALNAQLTEQMLLGFTKEDVA